MNQPVESWIGRTEERRDMISQPAVAAMAASLDLEFAPKNGEALPPGWQWLFFNQAVRRSGLGPDGHPAKGGFLPPVDLPRRMWAGSRIRYISDLPVGADSIRQSTIRKIEQKAGKRGALCFITLEHRILHDGNICIEEEQDIVYREPPPPGAQTKPDRHEDQPHWQEQVRPDTALLFRYSALTFNSHRIHYDQTYAREEEGYPDLVVHGPLTATLLQNFAVRHGGGRKLKRFEFRGVNPLFVNRPFQLEGRPEADGIALAIWARGPDGELAMPAAASFE